MMSKALLRTIFSLTLALLLTGSARATTTGGPQLVAGWNFSQYLGPSTLITGTQLTDPPQFTLPANFSDRDPVGAGAGAAAFGTLYYDGSNGSEAATMVGFPEVLPTSGQLQGNIDRTFVSSFTFENVSLDGQANSSLLSFAGFDALQIVFEADLGSLYLGDDWVLSFGGTTGTTGPTLALDVEVSTDGSNFQAVNNCNSSPGDCMLDMIETSAFEVDLPASLDGASEIFVRLSMLDFITIDNVAIEANVSKVPEPGTALLLLAGLAALRATRRRTA